MTIERQANLMAEKRPILFFVLGHHYLGGGGTYPPARDLEEFAAILMKYGVKGTFYFDGILVERLQAEDPRFFPRFSALGMGLGYHGEESHGPYPVIADYLYPGAPRDASFITGLTWDEAVRAIEERYTHAIEHGPFDLATHQIDVYVRGQSDLSRIGGLALVQQAFGREVDIMTTHSIEAAPAGHAFARMSRSQVVESTPPVAGHYFHIIRQPHLEKPAMALGGENARLFWYMNKLNTKAYSEDEAMVFVGTTSAQAKARLAALDRRYLHLVPIYMLPGPGASKDHFEEVIRYLATEFVPADDHSRFVTPQDMLALVESQNERPLAAGTLREMADYLRDHWQGRPPDWVRVGGGDFSLANAFEGLAVALAAYRAQGRLPEAVTNTGLLGPIGETKENTRVSPGSLPVSDLLAAAEQAAMQARTADPPRVPMTVAVGGRPLNAAEFLLAMARAYQTLAAGQEAEVVPAEPAEITPPYANILQTIFHPPDERPLWYSKLQLWTVKQARPQGIDL